jgi:twinkle protein
MQLLEDKDLLAFVGRQESQYIIKPIELLEKTGNWFTDDGSVKGDSLPWSKTHKYVGLRSGEVSIWAGINSHGKSQLLGQVCAWGLKTKKWLIASMEMLPEATMARMSMQMAGCRPSPEYLKKILDWTTNRLWIYDQIDSVKAERILAIIYYAATKLEINHIVIDSLMKCGIRKDDLNEQTQFVDKLCLAAKSTGCHVHLVHHIRKGERETDIPGKFDIRGAGEITDLVDNVFIVHRNKAKEMKRGKPDYDVNEHDCSLIIAKQRNGEWEGRFKLWFNPATKQYVPNPDNRIMQFNLD